MAIQPSVAATGFVQSLPQDIRNALLARGQRLTFRKGQIIQQRGDQAREFWYTESGSVLIGRYSLEGKFIQFARLGSGESFGEQAFLGEFPRMVDAIAGDESVLVRIGEAELQSLIEADIGAARLLLKTMAHTLQEAFDLLEASRNISVRGRLVQALLRLCGDGDDKVIITQQELADLIGVSRVSLGKELGWLRQEGLASLGYGHITIRARAALNALVET